MTENEEPTEDTVEPDAPEMREWHVNVAIHMDETGTPGFYLDISGDLSPIILGGVAWYLHQLAELGLANYMAAQAAAMEANSRPLIIPKGHLAKGGKLRMD